MGRKGRKQTAEFVTRLVEIGVANLVHQAGLQEPLARAAMRDIAHDVCREYGGQPMYIPQDHDFQLTPRDLAIFEAFRGTNIAEIAAEHGISTRQVYNIVAHARRIHAARNQPTLPGFDPDEPVPA